MLKKHCQKRINADLSKQLRGCQKKYYNVLRETEKNRVNAELTKEDGMIRMELTKEEGGAH